MELIQHSYLPQESRQRRQSILFHHVLTHFRASAGAKISVAHKQMKIKAHFTKYNIFLEPIRYREFWGSANTDPIRYQRSFFFLM